MRTASLCEKGQIPRSRYDYKQKANRNESEETEAHNNTKDEETKMGSNNDNKNMLRKMCLRPTWTLRRQLLTSFGLTGVVAIGAVMLIATLTTLTSGDNVKEEARQSLTDQVTANLVASTRYSAESLSRKLFDNLGTAAAILEESARDRVRGDYVVV